MRILLDLQTCQSKWQSQTIKNNSLSFALAIARNAYHHDIWILLNDRYPNTLPAIRQLFNPFVPKSHIVAVSIPAQTFSRYKPWHKVSLSRDSLTQISEQIREAFIASICPSLVHIANPFEDSRENIVTSIGKLSYPHPPTAVTLHEPIPASQLENYIACRKTDDYTIRKLEILERSSLILTNSKSIHRQVAEQLEVPPNRIVNLAAALESQSTLAWDTAAKQATIAFEKLSSQTSNLPVKSKQATEQPIYQQLITDISSHSALQNSNGRDLDKIASCIAANLGIHERQLLVDISQLVLLDEKSGIQRVVRSILIQLLKSPPPLYKVIPIYWDGQQYCHANKFVSVLQLEIAQSMQDTITTSSSGVDSLLDLPIDIGCNDIFLGLDLNAHLAPNIKSTLQQFRDSGIEVYFVVYDILLVHHPEWWPKDFSITFRRWLEVISEVSTGLICISQATALEVQDWLLHHPPQRTDSIRLESFHLGADIDQSLPSIGVPQNAQIVIQTLQAAPTLLIVSTLEPRKGHQQALQAFDLLWRAETQINLVIVGKQGWQVNRLVEKIKAHPEKDRQLFWLQSISDEYLDKIYSVSTALLSPSEGEGFGLPLIEAAQHRLPIIARDLPVYREVAGEHAFYFEGTKPIQLAEAIKTWLALYQQDKVPESSNINYLTWKQSTRQLLETILPDVPTISAT